MHNFKDTGTSLEAFNSACSGVTMKQHTDDTHANTQ